MKMADGGFRPAYNIEFGSDTQTQVIVGVDVVTTGSDMGQMAPMLEQVMQRCGQAPQNWLVDGGFPAHEQIDAVAGHTRVIAPVPKHKAKDEVQGPPTAPIDPHQRKPADSPAVGEWRERMATEEAKALYKERAATAECVNAQARNRGLVLLPVRGLKKVKAVALLFALAHNLMRMASLAPEMVGLGTGTSAIPGMTS